MNHRVCLLICGTLLLSGALAIPVENKAQDDSVLKIFETTDTENVQASPSSCPSNGCDGCWWRGRCRTIAQFKATQAKCSRNKGVWCAKASSCPSNGCDGCWWRGRCRTIPEATQAKCSRNKGVWCAKASTMKPTVCPSTNDICAGKAKCEPKCPCPRCLKPTVCPSTNDICAGKAKCEPKCLCPRCLKPTVCPSTKDICAGKAKCEPKCPCPVCKEPFPAANTKEYSKLKSACRGHVKNLDELKRLFEKQGGFEGALKYCVQPRPCPVAACARPKPGCHYVPNEKDANGCIVGCGKLECKEIEPITLMPIKPRPCPVAACARPKPGCRYVPNEKDANGCIVGCGKLECKEIEPKPIKRG